MFAAWLSASDVQIAEALRSQRTLTDPDYTTRDCLSPKGAELYESRSGTQEQHEHHHTNR